MRFERTIEVTRPIGEAFDYLADMSNAEAWDPGVAEARRLTGGAVAVGSEFEVVAAWRGRRIPFRYRVRTLEPDRRIVFDADADKARSTDTAAFEPAGAGTRIAFRSDWALKGWRRVAEPLLAPAVAASGRKALDGLRRALT